MNTTDKQAPQSSMIELDADRAAPTRLYRIATTHNPQETLVNSKTFPVSMSYDTVAKASTGAEQATVCCMATIVNCWVGCPHSRPYVSTKGLNADSMAFASEQQQQKACRVTCTRQKRGGSNFAVSVYTPGQSAGSYLRYSLPGSTPLQISSP